MDQRSGTWGLKNASYRQIAKAIEMLGGSFLRTGGNSHRIYELNGKRLTLVHPHKVNNLIGRSTLTSYIGYAEEAGIQPALFVAVLGAAGASWVRQPADLRELERLVKQNPSLLTYDKGRETLINTAEKAIVRRGIARSKSAAAEEQETGDKRPDSAFTHGMSEAIRLGGGDARWVAKFSSKLSTQLAKGEGLGGRLIENDHARKVFNPHPKVSRVSWMFTEAGALEIAQKVEQAIGGGEAPQKEEEAVAQPEPIKHQPAPLAPRPRTDAPNPDTERSMALLTLCQHHRILPAMVGMTLDIDATILRLAEAVNE